MSEATAKTATELRIEREMVALVELFLTSKGSGWDPTKDRSFKSHLENFDSANGTAALKQALAMILLALDGGWDPRDSKEFCKAVEDATKKSSPPTLPAPSPVPR